ncbi:MAG: hemolysin family protein [Alphaproteobacteria bacterium]|nr:hemolysin family protein [Alphaproteobacteria bacterium]
MSPDPEDPSSTKPVANSNGDGVSASDHQQDNNKSSLLAKLRHLVVKPKNDSDGLREALEEYIEELEDDNNDNPSIAKHEQALISNVLKLRNTTVIDVMIPRADIAAIEVNADQQALMSLLAEKPYSRIPVYHETLDEILGTVHIKDILSIVAEKSELNLRSLVRPVPIVSPSLPVLDLLLKMKNDKKHMVMVIDEYGGIDGLATIGDVIEAIVGDFDDEFDIDDDPQMIERNDGSVIADSRVDIEEFEDEYGQIFSTEEREEVDTLGGLVVYIASRIPARGEVIKHESGMVFEILDADQRRINSMRIRNIPVQKQEE